MKVKILTILAGPTLSAQPGDILDLDPPTARVLIDGHYAVPLDAPVAPVVETAAVAPGHPATSPRQRARPAK